jgi:hypothetical protein
VNVLRVLSTCFLWWIFAIWQYYFSKKNLCVGFDIFNNLLTFHCAWYKKCIVTPLFHDKTNTMIRMWDAMEYAIQTHYTQFFLKFHWNFKQVTWPWNQFIFQFWKLLSWNEKVYFYMNMKVHISILKIIISI